MILLLLMTVFNGGAAEFGVPQLKTVTGNELAQVVNGYAGKKAVLVNVWATWCPPCVKEFPDIVKLQKSYGDRLQVVFVSVDFPGAESSVIRFLEKQGVDWPTYMKTGKDEPFIAAVSAAWTGAIPATRIVNVSGDTVTFLEGMSTYEEFDTLVRKAMAPTAK